MGTAASTGLERSGSIRRTMDAASTSRRAAYVVQKDAVERNRQIEKDIAKAKKDETKTVKLMLVGASESGKSTFAKQMKILHLNGFTETELLNYRFLIYSNIMLAVNQILTAISDLKIGRQGLSTNDIDRFQSACRSSAATCEISSELGGVIGRIWKSKAAQDCYNRRSEFDLLDSAKYFLDEISRISNSHYSPTHQDILRSRSATTGVYEITFQFKGYMFRMVDVGGQKSERRKWLHCFDNVTALIFITSLSEYDQMLAEDKTVKRMHDSLALFDSLTNNTCFTKASVLLFLNKKDIFMEKIQTSPLTFCFPEYSGSNKDKEAGDYILNQFLKRKRSARPCYSHFTVATDTKKIEVVFAASIDTILKKALTSLGVY